MPIADEILCAVKELTNQGKTVFSREEIRAQADIDRQLWNASYSPVFQGMRSDGNGRPRVSEQYRSLFSSPKRGSHQLTEKGRVFIQGINTEYANKPHSQNKSTNNIMKKSRSTKAKPKEKSTQKKVKTSSSKKQQKSHEYTNIYNALTDAYAAIITEKKQKAINAWKKVSCLWPKPIPLLKTDGSSLKCCTVVKENGRKILLISDAMRKFYSDYITALKEGGYDAIIYVMCTKKKEPLYIGITRRWGSKNDISSNLKNDSAFGRWGFGRYWHIGGLSDAFFDKKRENKPQEQHWVKAIFKRGKIPILKEQVYFSCFLVKSESAGNKMTVPADYRAAKSKEIEKIEQLLLCPAHHVYAQKLLNTKVQFSLDKIKKQKLKVEFKKNNEDLRIIPCCKTKIPGGEQWSQELNMPSDITQEKRTDIFNDVRYRTDIWPLNGPEFGGQDFDSEYLTAIERYNGNLYTDNLSAYICNNPDHFVILSALYGPLHPKDSIQNYELRMTEAIARKWREPTSTYLTRFLEAHKGIERLHIYLSNTYLTALSSFVVQSLIKPPGKLREINIYKAYRDENRLVSQGSALPGKHAKLLSQQLGINGHLGDNPDYLRQYSFRLRAAQQIVIHDFEI